MYEMRTSRI